MKKGPTEQQDISLEQHGTRQRELHLPTTRQAANSARLPLLVEADAAERLDDLLATSLDTLVAQDEGKDRGLLLGTIDIVLDVEGTDDVGGGEALDLAVGDSSHESGLK